MKKNKSFLGTGWSFPPRFDDELSSVSMVSEEEDIRESLYLLLSTYPGERMTNPEYGCDIHSLIYRPITNSTVHLLKDVIKMAVLDYEPRITLEDIEVDTRDEIEGVVYITLHYTIRKTNVRTNVVYPFYKIEGTNIVEV